MAVKSCIWRITILDTLPDVDLSDDPDDNPLLTIASVGGADYLVSGDKRYLLSRKIVGKTCILTARRFLTVLKK